MSESRGVCNITPEISPATYMTSTPLPETREAHYNDQTRRLIAILQEMVNAGYNSFLLDTSSPDWTIRPVASARLIKR